MNTLLRLLLSLAMMAAALPLSAQPDRSADDAEPRYYVEVIVFERDDAQEKLYRWPGEPAVRSAMDLWRALEPSPVFSQRPATTPSGNPGPLLPTTELFQARDGANLIMVREWQALSADPWLTPLAHRGWHQPAIAFGDPQPIRIWGGATVGRTATDATGLLLSGRTEPIYQVDGTAALERGRFLHLRLDIAVHRPGRPNSTHYSDLKTLEQPGDFMTYRIQERRQVTVNAVNYFDHAFLGVVALVKTWPLDQPGAAENP